MDGRFLHVVEHYTALKRSKALTAATTWVNPENTVLNERHYCCIICTAGKSRDKRETGQAIPKTGSGWWLLGTRTGNRVQVPAGLGFCSEGGTCRWRVHCLSPASNPGRCGGPGQAWGRPWSFCAPPASAPTDNSAQRVQLDSGSGFHCSQAPPFSQPLVGIPTLNLSAPSLFTESRPS